MHTFKQSLLAVLVAATASCGHTEAKTLDSSSSSIAMQAIPAHIRKTIDALVGPNAKVTRKRNQHYEALTHTEFTIELSDTGVLQAAEVALPAAALPTAVAAAAGTKGTITEAEIVVTPNGVFFEVEVKTTAGEFEVTIDGAGTILSTDQEKPDGADDEADDN